MTPKTGNFRDLSSRARRDPVRSRRIDAAKQHAWEEHIDYRLGDVRRVLGLTQQELAELIGKSQSAVSQIETGEIGLSVDLPAADRDRTGRFPGDRGSVWESTCPHLTPRSSPEDRAALDAAKWRSRSSPSNASLTYDAFLCVPEGRSTWRTRLGTRVSIAISIARVALAESFAGQLTPASLSAASTSKSDTISPWSTSRLRETSRRGCSCGSDSSATPAAS